MSTTETTYATLLHEWLPSQPELQKPYIHAKALPFDCWTACFRCVVEAS